MEKFKLSSLTDQNFSKAVSEIYLFTDCNRLQYPDYYKWFYSKNIPRVLNGEGDIIFIQDGFVIVGLSILKKTDEEKICTFMVSHDYRGKGIGHELLKDSFNYLGTTKPVISIPEFRLEEFSSIIDAYKWEESRIINNYNSKEIEFNSQKTLVKKRTTTK